MLWIGGNRKGRREQRRTWTDQMVRVVDGLGLDGEALDAWVEAAIG